MSAREVPRIAIVGGGIGGLAACAFLHGSGLAVTVYEQAPQLAEVGAGLVVAPNAIRLLRRLGVMRHFLSRAVALEWGWEFRRWENGAVLSAERLAGTVGAAGPGTVDPMEHRAGHPARRCGTPDVPLLRPGRGASHRGHRLPGGLPRHRTGRPGQALKRYESARIARTTRIQQLSHDRADTNHLPDGPRQRARDADLTHADPLRRNGWIYSYDAEAAAAASARRTT